MSSSTGKTLHKYQVNEKEELIAHLKAIGASLRARIHETDKHYYLPSGKCPDDAEFIGLKANSSIGKEKEKPLDIYVSKPLFASLQKDMKEDDQSDVFRLSQAKLVRTFVYFDISAFSSMSAKNQYYAMTFVTKCLDHFETTYQGYKYETRLCIGDGYILVFKRPTDACVFASILGVVMDRGEPKRRIGLEINFRIGIHMGKVRCYWDKRLGTKGGWNYVGDAINGGQRIVAMVKDDKLDNAIYISSQVYRVCYPSGTQSRETDLGQKITSCCLNRGTHEDKHHNAWRVYQLNHAACAQEIGVQKITGKINALDEDIKWNSSW